MEIKKSAVVGTLESSDIMITLNPSTAGRIDIQLESSVEKQFGNQIRRVIEETLKELGVTSVEVIAVDNAEWLFDNIFCHQNSMVCTPWLLTTFRYRESFWQCIDTLENKFCRDMTLIL